MIRIFDFFREHKEVLVIVGGFILTLAGFLTIILGHLFLGLLLLFGGLIGWQFGFKKILDSGGYDMESTMSRGLKGQGRQQSEAYQKSGTPVHTEVNSSIWGQMTGSDDKN